MFVTPHRTSLFAQAGVLWIAVVGACSSSVEQSPPNSGGGGAAQGGTGGIATGGGETGGGGEAQPACTPPAEGCGMGEKCSIVDEGLGIPAGLGCVDLGTRSAYEPCDADAVCAAGLWCDYTTAVCKPLCDVGELACADAADCVIGRDSAGLPIIGLAVCLARCNPHTAPTNPCSDGDKVTCFYRSDEDAFDCGQGNDFPWPNSCSSHLECAYGLGCIQGTCRDWCPVIGNECLGEKPDGSSYCENFTPCGTCSPSGLTYEGAALGVCL